MNTGNLISLIFGSGSTLGAIFAVWRSVQADRRAAETQAHSAAREEMEAALRARADDYNRVRAEVIELRQRCDELEDRALLAEEEARSARRQCDQLRQENTRLSTRLSRIEGELH